MPLGVQRLRQCLMRFSFTTRPWSAWCASCKAGRRGDTASYTLLFHTSLRQNNTGLVPKRCMRKALEWSVRGLAAKLPSVARVMLGVQSRTFCSAGVPWPV